MGEDDQKLNMLRNFSSSKIWLKKKFLKGFQKYRGREELRPFELFPKRRIFFLPMASLSHSGLRSRWED